MSCKLLLHREEILQHVLLLTQVALATNFFFFFFSRFSFALQCKVALHEVIDSANVQKQTILAFREAQYRFFPTLVLLCLLADCKPTLKGLTTSVFN